MYHACQVLIQISKKKNLSQTATVSQDYVFSLLESTSEVFSHEFVWNWNRLHLNWEKIEIV